MRFSLGVACKSFGIEQTLVAERTGLSRKSIGDYASGRAFPSRRHCKLIEDTLFAIVMERVRAEVTAQVESALVTPLPPSARYERLDDEASE